jgi:hypothetical protein
MHLNDGELRAYQDRELDPQENERASAHLAACAACRRRAEQLLERSRQVNERIAAIASSTLPPPVSSRTARARLEARISEKEKQTMFQKVFARSYRPAWVALGVVALLAAALAFPPVQAIANSFLGLFRVEQVSVIPINPGNLPQQLGDSSQFEAMLSTDVEVHEGGEAEDLADAAEASQKAGFGVRLPASAGEPAALKFQPGSSAVFHVDQQHVSALLQEIGRSDIQIPEGVDGAAVTLEVANSVAAMYGECDFDPQAAHDAGFDPDSEETPYLPNCTTLIQMPSPTISAPPGLDIASIGEAYLQVMGMTPEEASRFAQTVDWTTTLVVPIPRYGTAYEEVTVDGVPGTLIQRSPESRRAQYALIWVKDGILYALTGPGVATDALALGDSLQ